MLHILDSSSYRSTWKQFYGLCESVTILQDHFSLETFDLVNIQMLYETLFILE